MVEQHFDVPCTQLSDIAEEIQPSIAKVTGHVCPIPPFSLSYDMHTFRDMCNVDMTECLSLPDTLHTLPHSNLRLHAFLRRAVCTNLANIYGELASDDDAEIPSFTLPQHVSAAYPHVLLLRCSCSVEAKASFPSLHVMHNSTSKQWKHDCPTFSEGKKNRLKDCAHNSICAAQSMIPAILYHITRPCCPLYGNTRVWQAQANVPLPLSLLLKEAIMHFSPSLNQPGNITLHLPLPFTGTYVRTRFRTLIAAIIMAFHSMSEDESIIIAQCTLILVAPDMPSQELLNDFIQAMGAVSEYDADDSSYDEFMVPPPCLR